MEYRIFGDKAVLKIDKGEEVITSIMKFIEETDIKLASVVGLGASNNIDVGLFDTSLKKYFSKNYSNEDFEVSNFTGNITTKDGNPYLHMHITFSNKDQETFGGHLNKCLISGACELFIDIYDGNVGRILDDNIGINVLKF